MTTTTTTTANGWVSASGGKWHRATTPEPQWDREEETACGLTFRPVNVTFHGDRPWHESTPQAMIDHYTCSRHGCREENA